MSKETEITDSDGPLKRLDTEVVRSLLRYVVEQARIPNPDGTIQTAVLLRPIKSRIACLQMSCPKDIQLVEIIERENGIGKHARIYFPVARPPQESPYVPVVLIGGESTIAKLAERERLPAHHHNGIIDLTYAHPDLVVTDRDLEHLEDLTDILHSSNEPVSIAHRRATFVLSSVSNVALFGSPSLVKTYRDWVNPQSREFFAHILSWNETSPLLSDSPLGSIAGVCASNSPKYISNHPELQFV